MRPDPFLRKLHAILLAAVAALMLTGGEPALARRKPAPPPPQAVGTLIDNVNGYALGRAGEVIRFTGLLADDDGRVKQLLKQGDARPYARFRTDAGGRTMVPGLIAPRQRVMALGRKLLADARAAAGERQLRDNAVDREAALTLALRALAGQGVTTVEDAGSSIDDWLLYRQFGDEGRLTIRIRAVADGMDVLENVAPLRPTPWLYGERLSMRAVLLKADGSAPSSPADARIRNQMSRASMAGAQSIADAPTDAGVRQAIDAVAEMLPAYGKDRRYRIDASRPLQPAEQAQADAMGVIVLGQGGVPPFAAGHAPAARAIFAEDRLGTLDPGKWADFVLLDRDVMAEGGTANVLESWVGAKRAYVRAVSSAMPPAPKP